MIQNQYTPEHYTGDGVTANLPFAWRILTKTDLTVYAVSTAGAISTLTLDTDYTIADADVDTEEGGDVVLTVPATWDDYEIFLVRGTSMTQLVHMPEGAPFSTAAVEKVLDRLTMMAQELKYLYRQSIHYPTASAAVDVTLAEPEAGNLIQYNTAADAFDNTTASSLSLTHTIVTQAVVATDTTAVITHNLGSASANLVGFSSSWHTSFIVLSQDANTITIEFGTECPAGGGTITAEVAL